MQDSSDDPIITAPSHLEFTAYLSVEHWIAEPSRQNDERLLRLLTSGDEAAVQVITWSVYRSRMALGHRWWRLLYFALLWSGLLMLRPHHSDDKDEETRWQKWLHWLHTRSPSEGKGTAASINLLGIAQRVERLEVKR